MHVTDTLPRHPLLDVPMLRPEMIQHMTVRILEDADILYAEDPRWDTAADHEKAFAIGILSKITGNEYPVLNSDHNAEMNTLFYNLLIRPKIQAMNVVTGPQTVGYAFIPADYCTVEKSGYWEAK